MGPKKPQTQDAVAAGASAGAPGAKPASVLTRTNWNDEWKTLQRPHDEVADAAHWDSRAKTFPTAHGSQSDYVKEFLRLADVKPGQTALDIGCGTGMLTIPLADAGVHMHAADISTGMLDQVRATATPAQLENITLHRMSWTDNWDDFGLGENSVDVAIASRSFITPDLEESLLKLDRAARERVCITLPCAMSPHADETLLDGVGIPRHAGIDFVYAFNILAYHGICPRISYIESMRNETYESVDAAVKRFTPTVVNMCREMEDPALAESALARLRPWLEEHLVPNEEVGKVDNHGVEQKALRLRVPRKVVWAYLSWDV